MKKIYVIGIGPGNEDSLTLGAVRELNSKRNTFLRTIHHPTVRYLDRNGIEYKSYDKIYEESEDFIEVYNTIANNLVEKAEEFDEINYCVPGHPLIAEKTVEILLNKQKEGKIDIEIIEGLSFIEPMILSMQRDPIDGLKIIDGLNLLQKPDINFDNLITQVYSRERASELKLMLSEIYGDEYEVYVIRAAGMKEEKKAKMPIYEIDRVDWLDDITSIYLPKVNQNDKSIYDFNDLLGIMEELRGEDGCSWDIKQTHESLRKYLIEEAYEVVDTIDNDDIDGLQEELGDLLLQIVFHSQIAREEGYFNIWDVIKSISKKMINRHPKIFDSSEYSEHDNWNEIKAKEKSLESHSERINSIPKSLPSLIRSEKVQKRASDAGFDWENYRGALEKIYEEIEEVKEEIDKYCDSNEKYNTVNKLDEELGDLLFSVVNLCRFFKVDSERALYDATDKFIERFMQVEKKVLEKGLKLNEMNLDELDKIWNEIK